MTTFLYIEINIVGIIILLLLYFSKRHSVIITATLKSLNDLTIATILILIFDSLMWFADGKTFPGARELNTSVSAIYYILMTVCSLLWLRYCSFKVYGDKKRYNKKILLYAIPLFCCIVLSLLSCFNGWLFYVDNNNIYHRGKLMQAAILLTMIYWIYAAALIIFKIRKTETRSEKQEYLLLLLYSILPIVGGVVQTMFYGISVIWICQTIAILILNFKHQYYQLSTDVLTGINNRWALRKFVENEIILLNNNRLLFAIIVDIDNFKHINDTYGHAEGDIALINVADILRTVCDKNNDFLARMGGDEFIIIGQRNYRDDIYDIIEIIDNKTAQFYNKPTTKYKLTLSIGHAVFDACTEHTIDSFISAADMNMYAQKKNKQ